MSRVYFQDALLVLAWVVLFFLPWPVPIRGFLLGAIPLVVAWGALTLHFPAKVDVDETKVVFSRYGRAHTFAWRDVERVRVRRFLVKDRVLVRLEPSPAWRGKYWIVDSVSGFDGIVAAIEARTVARITSSV
jgi:hypothetical protein